MALRGPRRIAVVVAGLAVLLALANWGVLQTRWAWDLTAEGSATLSDGTLRVLDALDRRVRVTAFFAREDVGRVEAATLLARYRRVNRLVSWRILDPTQAPGEAQRLGIIQRGSAAVESLEGEQDVEIAPFVIEIDVTSAIARLQRDTSGTVCFTAGHGERDPDDPAPDGMARAAAILQDNGYDIRTIDLLASPQVPEDCDAIVIAAPATDLPEHTVGFVRAYLERSGKALILSDPDAGGDPSEVTRPWRISFQRGVVVEEDPGARLLDDPSSPIVTTYAEASAVVRGLGPTFFPRVQGVVVDDSDRASLSVFGVAQTSAASFLDVGDADIDLDDDDVTGPVVIGAVADDSRVRGTGREAEIERTRIVAWGDVDFATNLFIGEAANARLFVQAVDHLTQPEDVVAAVPSFPKVRELELTEARGDYLVFLTAGVIPGLFLIAGGFVWVLRRGR